MSPKFDRFASVRLARHTGEFSVMFVVLAIAAMALNFVVRLCRLADAPALLLQIFTLLEYAIVIADSLVLLLSLARGGMETSQGDRVMQESLAEEFRWAARCYMRMFCAPFVGAVKEFLYEFRKYGAELDARLAGDRQPRAEGTGPR